MLFLDAAFSKIRYPCASKVPIGPAIASVAIEMDYGAWQLVVSEENDQALDT